MATTQGTKKHRADRTAPGQEVRVGDGRKDAVTNRCKETHDVPWSERCVLDRWHDVPSVYLGRQATPHKDKRGDTW